MAPIKSFHAAPHSLVQAAAAVYFKKQKATIGIATARSHMEEITAILKTFPRRRVSEPRTQIAASTKALSLSIDPACAALAYDYAVAVLEGDKAQAAIISSEFEKSSCDVTGWAGAAIDYMASQAEFWKPIVYTQAPSPPDDSYVYKLPEQNKLTIGILGDWGTGESVAQLVINAMMAMDIDLMIHVGDVYYAGTSDEVNSNYLGMISAARQATGSNVPVYNLPGNHDYYTKGQPFYDALGTVNVGASFPGASTPSPTQEASFFALQNSWLQLQGMDTGYFDSDLFAVDNDTTSLWPNEAAWHLNQLTEAKDAGRAVFLFSHHQPWSRFATIGDGSGAAGGTSDPSMQMLSYNVNLQSQFAGASLDTVRAWFWGHEHVLEVYDQEAISQSNVTAPDGTVEPLSAVFPWVNYGACIGYSAFPMLMDDGPYNIRSSDIASNEAYRLPDPSGDIDVYAHGFAVLSVTKNQGAPPTAQVTYYSLPGDGSSPTATAVQPTFTIPQSQGPMVS